MNLILFVGIAICLIIVIYTTYYLHTYPAPHSGQIISKQYKKSNRSLSDDWCSFVIQDRQGLRGLIYIDEATWNTLKVGDFYTIPQTPTDQNYFDD